MGDSIDRAQDREQLDREFALRDQLNRQRVGLCECEECGDSISPLRRSLGARLCVMHQEAFEAELRKRGARTCV
ncbi:hypothetical protein N789_14125 [Arenimonas oryziterrae DSM 21050 = YC6267]|uniref:DksA C4-type domain-containing protein n=1 Tax=Arenimonas oryziterrae DSM 21050 = YC6267 TaxID=1121015 RepID=A0A091ATI3_9GAMM|nr:hypothetical protein N789_14125 [Arenimonas oryziterrae DSM 21050 = YC6267]